MVITVGAHEWEERLSAEFLPGHMGREGMAKKRRDTNLLNIPTENYRERHDLENGGTPASILYL